MVLDNINVKYSKKKVKKFSLLQKITLTTCLALGFTVTTAHAADEDLETIYHVYIDGEHIGKVSDEAIIKEAVKEKIEESNEESENLKLTIGEDIDFISEKVFNPTYENEKVANKIEEETSIMAEAIELKIGNKTVGFFNDQETIDKVIKAYKLKYVDESDLEKMEKEKQQSNDREETPTEDVREDTLELGETIVTDVVFTEDITVTKAKALPEDLLSKDEGLTSLEKGTLEKKIHTVDNGEVLSEIADNYNLSIDKLLQINPDLKEDSLIQIGQDIQVMDYEPFVDVIVKEVKLVEETIDYETEIIESDDLYKGEQKVKQDGKDGKKEVQYSIEKVNGSEKTKEIVAESVKEKSVEKVIIKGTKVIPSRGTGELTDPTVGGYVSSKVGERWGRTHKGIDIAGPSNRNILAADNGVVESAGYNNGGYGNKVVINHNNGMKTIYAHLASIDVKAGQTVEKGHKIGVMGSTGNSTGVHLHFEVYKNGSLKNPLDYVY
ncbi:M23 family metallopeptidase [Oceanobacillus halophilus]|uniref:M23 family metallopeptidase n=1 Tax=Oceanobacillus halophilus TaxID=930130 RepID=A0A495A0V2_9BACI|nr:M23 family metallopeptidase [Oceanobacillus halophilus]RKQ32947.1 M23 family metallopeptidase [Oceanobacillus halophilus]